jgi:hypothetical protein
MTTRVILRGETFRVGGMGTPCTSGSWEEQMNALKSAHNVLANLPGRIELYIDATSTKFKCVYTAANFKTECAAIFPGIRIHFRLKLKTCRTQNTGIIKSLRWASRGSGPNDLYVLTRNNLHFKPNSLWDLRHIEFREDVIVMLNPIRGPPNVTPSTHRRKLRPRSTSSVAYFGYERGNDVFSVFPASMLNTIISAITMLNAEKCNGYHELADPVLQHIFNYGVSFISHDYFETNTTFETNPFYRMVGRPCGEVYNSNLMASTTN